MMLISAVTTSAPMTDADWQARRGHARLMLWCALASALFIVGLGSLFLGL